MSDWVPTATNVTVKERVSGKLRLLKEKSLINHNVISIWLQLNQKGSN